MFETLKLLPKAAISWNIYIHYIFQMILAGQKPEVISEVCSRALSFWVYQVYLISWLFIWTLDTVYVFKFLTFLFLFSKKMLVIRARNHKTFVRIANREDPNQTASPEAV